MKQRGIRIALAGFAITLATGPQASAELAMTAAVFGGSVQAFSIHAELVAGLSRETVRGFTLFPKGRFGGSGRTLFPTGQPAGSAQTLELDPAVVAREYALGAAGASGVAPKSADDVPGWYTGKPTAASWITTGVVAATLGGIVLGADAEDLDEVQRIEDLGDITQILVPAAGFAMAAGAGDWEGSLQLAKALGVQVATVGLFKEVSEKWRPNFSNTASFPSGHTSAAFLGSAFIHRRYGPKWGVPAHVVAAYTGYSRAWAQKHFLDDVLSGMAVGVMSNLLMTRPIDEDRLARYEDLERPRPWRFSWEIGGGSVRTNNVRTKPDGTPLDFAFVGEANPTTTALLVIERRLGASGRHELAFTGDPFEIREIDEAPYDIVFAGRVFAEGTSVVTLTLLHTWNTRYSFAVLDLERFKIRLGAGASYQDTELGLAVSGEIDDELDYTYVTDRRLVPYGHVRFEVRLTRDLELLVGLDSWDTGSFDFFNDSYLLRYHVGPRWDLSLGFRRFERNLDSASLTHELKRDGSTFAFGYSF